MDRYYLFTKSRRKTQIWYLDMTLLVSFLPVFLYILASLSLRLNIHFVWIQAVTPKKRKKEEKPELPQHQNPNVDESTRIRISQILESFLASNDEGEE